MNHVCCGRRITPNFTHYAHHILEVWFCPRCGKMRQESFPKVYVGSLESHGGHPAPGNANVTSRTARAYFKNGETCS